jgi:hypothetical protein
VPGTSVPGTGLLGGRFAGSYNTPDHLRELWVRVAPGRLLTELHK